MTRLAGVIAVAVITMAACSGDDDAEEATASTDADAATTAAATTAGPATTATPATTTTAAATTTSTTTTTTPPTTTAPEPGNVGVVWHSVVNLERVNQPADTQPTFTADGVTSRIDMFLMMDADTDGDAGDACRDAIDRTPAGDDEQCLLVQWSFDVAADFPGEEALLSARQLLNPDGRQIDSAVAAVGVPGANGVGLTELYAGGEAGSTLRFDTGGNEVGFTTHVVDVPPRDAFQPIGFN